MIGEQGLLWTNGQRSADLVVANGAAVVLEIRREALDGHRDARLLWRNCSRILSLKLAGATAERSGMLTKIRDQRGLLRKYVGPRALSEEQLFPETFTDSYKKERVVVWFSDVVGFSSYSWNHELCGVRKTLKFENLAA